jgi:hypothetical protein
MCPVADITEVRFTYADGVKAREEYAPPRKAEATIIATVPEGHDGAIALSYVANIARAKVLELLTGVAPSPLKLTSAEPVKEPLAPAALALVENPGAVEPPKTRTRRTNAQIAADKAAEEASKPVGETDAPATTGSPAQTADGDDWGVSTEAPPVTDEAILKACSEASAAGKKRDDILALIATYKTTATGVQFFAKDIATNFRADFLAKLKAL